MTEHVEIYTADGVYIRQIVLEGRMIVPQHSHAWDHTTMLAIGSMRVWRDGELDPAIYTAPCGIFIKAGVKHSFLTLGDKTVLYCIHNLHSEAAVKILEEHELSPTDAYALTGSV